MTTKLVKTLETDTPLPEIQARWAHIALYGDIMPKVRQVRPLDGQRWQWTTDQGVWTIDDVQQRAGQLVSWHARSGDTDYRATVLFTALKDGQGSRLVFTLHYPHGIGPDADAQAIEADMLTTLRRSAGLLDRTPDAPIEVPASVAATALPPADEALAQVVESAETLQATLSEVANVWARSMTDSLKIFQPQTWLHQDEEAEQAQPALLQQARRQKAQEAAASELQT